MNTEKLTKIGNKVAELTEVNAHTEAYIAVAKFLKETVILGKLQTIRHDQERRGYLHHKLNEERYALLQQLKDSGVHQYGEEFLTHVYSKL